MGMLRRLWEKEGASDAEFCRIIKEQLELPHDDNVAKPGALDGETRWRNPEGISCVLDGQRPDLTSGSLSVAFKNIFGIPRTESDTVGIGVVLFAQPLTYPVDMVLINCNYFRKHY